MNEECGCVGRTRVFQILTEGEDPLPAVRMREDQRCGGRLLNTLRSKYRWNMFGKLNYLLSSTMWLYEACKLSVALWKGAWSDTVICPNPASVTMGKDACFNKKKSYKNKNHVQGNNINSPCPEGASCTKHLSWWACRVFLSLALLSTSERDPRSVFRGVYCKIELTTQF